MWSWLNRRRPAALDGEWWDPGLPLPAAPVRGDAALKHAIVYSCAGLLAGIVAQSPIRVSRADGSPGGDPALERMLNVQPEPLFTGHTFWFFLVASMLISGGGMGFARIIRDARGRVLALRACHPESVRSRLTDAGRASYRVRWRRAGATAEVHLDQDDMLAVPGEFYDGLRSRSVVRWGAARSIGLQASMESAAEDHFRSGALQRLAITFKSRRSAEQLKQYRKGYRQAYGRGTRTRHVPLMLDEDATVTPLSLSAEDTQLLENREFTVDDIARAFRVPSFLVNREQKTTSFGSGVTEIAHSFARFTMRPILHRVAAEVERKLLPRDGSLTCRHDTTELTRAVESERFRANRVATGGPWMTVNEARAREGLDPVAAGDDVRQEAVKETDEEKEK